MAELNIKNIQKLCEENKIAWSLHSLKRIRERNIKSSEVIECILNGEIIEYYPDDKPLPSCLIYGEAGAKHIHTVVGSDEETVYIITAYYPNSDEWESDLKTRKGQN